MNHPACAQYELRYEPLFDRGRSFAFPCDEGGLVDLDSLSDRARLDYLYARVMVGLELAPPAVVPG